MHVPDGFLDAPTSMAAGAVAIVGIGCCLAGSRRELTERSAPLAGLVAAFVFAAQMLNFPVASGTSGHLLGGALAAILIGPWTGAICVTVVLIVQSLLFADGGLTALGVNVTLMAFVTSAVGYGGFRLMLTMLPRTLHSVPIAAFVGAFISVPMAALGFVGFYAVGGTTHLPIGNVAVAVVGIHVLIGFGEAVITGLTVGSVIAVRPDLVYGARRLIPAPALQVRSVEPRSS